jgi:response regulator RpfG family c-di-GMP phosphodiesterase
MAFRRKQQYHKWRASARLYFISRISITMALILVVEDENYVQIFIREALEDAGHEVALARSGKEASLLCRERETLT